MVHNEQTEAPDKRLQNENLVSELKGSQKKQDNSITQGFFQVVLRPEFQAL